MQEHESPNVYHSVVTLVLILDLLSDGHGDAHRMDTLVPLLDSVLFFVF